MTRKAIVVSAGGHCRVLLSILAARGEHEIMGIVDLSEPRGEEVIMGVPVIGSIACLESFRDNSLLDIFLAVGDNSLRRKWWQKLGDLGLTLPNLISPHAIVDPHAHLGDGNVVCARAFIGPQAFLGNNNLINTAVVLEHEVRVGSHCHIAPSATLAGRSQIGDGCFVGAGATIIDYVEIPDNTSLGAGATVVRNITDPGLYVGVPAKKV